MKHEVQVYSMVQLLNALKLSIITNCGWLRDRLLLLLGLRIR
jgi:hypothetical protein